MCWGIGFPSHKQVKNHMENINDLSQSTRERIETLKVKSPLAEEELYFLRARIDYLTDEEKEKLFPVEEPKEDKKAVKRKK